MFEQLFKQLKIHCLNLITKQKRRQTMYFFLFFTWLSANRIIKRHTKYSKNKEKYRKNRGIKNGNKRKSKCRNKK